MKKKNLCVIILIILIIGIVACGCGLKQNNMEPSVIVTNDSIEINERQKDILEKQGLSSDINELTVSQINSIVAIEKMLKYLENKYNQEFKYVGYTATGNLGKETLRACASNGDPQIDSFDVTKTDNVYVDEYMNVVIRDDYTQYVEELMYSSLGNERLKVFSEVYTTELTEIPTDENEYNGNVSSWKVLFIYLSQKGEDEISKNLATIQQVLESKKLGYDCDVIFLKEDVVSELTEYNYIDYFYSEYYEKRHTIEIDVYK